MIGRKKFLRKVTIATGVVAMSVGLSSSLTAVYAQSSEYGPAQTKDCAGAGTGDYVYCASTNEISCTRSGCQ